MKKLLIFLGFFLYLFLFKSPIYASTLTVCPSGCQYQGGEGIQQAIDAAKSGDTVVIQPGDYTKNTFVDENGMQCFLDTKGKDLVIQGQGAAINSQNDEIGTGVQGLFRTGVCAIGGKVTVDGLKIVQTLGPAIVGQQTQLIVKNVTFLDIDNTIISLRQSQAGIYNILVAGGGNGVTLGDTSYARIENSTFLAGGTAIVFDLCKTNQPTGDVNNNIIVARGNPIGIGANCKNENAQKLSGIKTANNIVWKADAGDCVSGPPQASQYPDCADNEICTGVKIAFPDFVGDGTEAGTVCTWGDGPLYSGGATPKDGSVAATAQAGYSFGPCSNGASSACSSYIQSHPFPSPPSPTTNTPSGPGPTTGGGQKGGGGQSQGQINFFETPFILPVFLDQNLAKLKGSVENQPAGIDLFLFILLSVVYIMTIHFAVAINNEFNVFQTAIYFVLGGLLGWYLKSYELGLVVGIVLSLLFW